MIITQQVYPFMYVHDIVEHFKSCRTIPLFSYSFYDGIAIYARSNFATMRELVVHIEDDNGLFKNPDIDIDFLRRASKVTVYAFGKKRVTMYEHRNPHNDQVIIDVLNYH